MENQFSPNFHFKHFPLSSLTRTGRSSLTRTQSLTSSDPHIERRSSKLRSTHFSVPIRTRRTTIHTLDTWWVFLFRFSLRSTHENSPICSFFWPITLISPIHPLITSVLTSTHTAPIHTLHFSLRPTQLRPT